MLLGHCCVVGSGSLRRMGRNRVVPQVVKKVNRIKRFWLVVYVWAQSDEVNLEEGGTLYRGGGQAVKELGVLR